MDVVEFLSARLDEDEQVAQAAVPGPWRWGELGMLGTKRTQYGLIGGPASIVLTSGMPDVYPSKFDARHIARHDPVRALADVAAKRAILAEHDDVHCCCGRTSRVWPDIDSDPEVHCPTVRLLAQPFADHPDFDPAWKVEP